MLARREGSGRCRLVPSSLNSDCQQSFLAIFSEGLRYLSSHPQAGVARGVQDLLCYKAWTTLSPLSLYPPDVQQSLFSKLHFITALPEDEKFYRARFPNLEAEMAAGALQTAVPKCCPGLWCLDPVACSPSYPTTGPCALNPVPVMFSLEWPQTEVTHDVARL